MPTFKVELAQTTIERATVFIECGSAAEAERLAVKESRHADWHFAEAYGDIEVIGVEESKNECEEPLPLHPMWQAQGA